MGMPPSRLKVGKGIKKGRPTRCEVSQAEKEWIDQNDRLLDKGRLNLSFIAFIFEWHHIYSFNSNKFPYAFPGPIDSSKDQYDRDRPSKGNLRLDTEAEEDPGKIVQELHGA